MKIRHSKYKNTGLIFELLVKQIASDILNKKDSPAVGILRKYFTGKTALVREFGLYELVSKNKGISQSRAEAIVSTITEVSRKIDVNTLKSQKYKLIEELNKNYKLEDFFSIKVTDYKPLAALYCLLEVYRANDIVDPEFLINNKTTVLEHLTASSQNKEDVRDKLIEEYSKYDKDLKLLTFKILLEKFNSKYDTLLPEQKNTLREFITSVDSSTRLRTVVNEEFSKLRVLITELKGTVKDSIVKIKLEEVLKGITPVPKTRKITDNHLVDILQYYELVKELRAL